ncbi:hypothetical protein IX296_002581 [Bacteroides pyogenes]|nr:hypothetical protein [Bacteroides pyogenes]MBR8706883.1 hypothetical protein [Bacteroides pyogenes]MBR8726186.1 hypothetical protein [Bacteroides pyogenes]MBR8739565.1 hypothetical protein [Bacteroides pyogenes]MBR8755393.1 hypothetical protein [Bacteroides pyogenes]MBR8796679.1 hypothetical protein [Bacteroides pyogenes]
MKEKILAALKTKFVGVDEAILSRIAEKKAGGVTDESQVPAIVEGVSFQDVLTSYGDYRAGDATTTAVKNYEKKHNLKDGKPVEQGKPKEEKHVEEDDVPAWAQSLIDSNKALSEKLAGYEADRAKQERSAQISAKAKEYGIPEKLVPMLNIADDADLDTYMKDAKQTFANLGFKDAQSPDSGAGNKNDIDSLADKIAQGTKEILQSKK